MEMRSQFTFYESFYRAISRIKKAADRAVCYDAIARYALYGDLPDMDLLPETAAMAFELIVPTLDASRHKAENRMKSKSALLQKVSASNEEQTKIKTEQTEIKSEQADNKTKQTVKEKENKKEKEKECEKEREKENDSSLSPITPFLKNVEPVLGDAVKDWLQYKQERRETYKPTGLKNLLCEVLNARGKHGDVAVADCIKNAMGQNWAGMHLERLDEIKPKGPKKPGYNVQKHDGKLTDIERRAVAQMLEGDA